MNIQELYQFYQKSYKVSTDTRKIAKDSIFFALKGDNFNGNLFAEEALIKGASYAIVDDKKYNKHPKTILVKDALKTLQSLATYHREKLGIPIIGLTGSNGKTTTKELINAVLSTGFKTVATTGNLNNHIGVPLTILSMTPETEIGIVEMGANHLKEIELLCNIALPDYGYITNFGKAHLEGFGSVKGVIQGKTELYQHLKNHNKKVFVNANDIIQIDNSKNIDSVKFGSSNAEILVDLIEANPFVILKFNSLTIRSKLIGVYNFNNIAAAIAIGNYFKISAENIKEGIENYVPANNRSQIVRIGSNAVILDAYNANPTSMLAALSNLSSLSDLSKVAILGDMFELGKDSIIEHQNIVDLITEFKFKNTFLIGENFFKTTSKNTNIQFFRTFEEFKSHFSKLKFENETLLIKASRGMALERIIDLL